MNFSQLTDGRTDGNIGNIYGPDAPAPALHGSPVPSPPGHNVPFGMYTAQRVQVGHDTMLPTLS